MNTSPSFLSPACLQPAGVCAGPGGSVKPLTGQLRLGFASPEGNTGPQQLHLAYESEPTP